MAFYGGSSRSPAVAFSNAPTGSAAVQAELSDLKREMTMLRTQVAALAAGGGAGAVGVPVAVQWKSAPSAELSEDNTKARLNKSGIVQATTPFSATMVRAGYVNKLWLPCNPSLSR